MQKITANLAAAGKAINYDYTYDKVGNITDLKNDTAIPPANSFGGPPDQTCIS